MRKHLYTYLGMLAGLLALTRQPAQAQSVADYTFIQRDTTYAPLAGDSVVSDFFNDDNVYDNIRIGFDFTYGGGSFSSLSMSPNGVIALGEDVFDIFGVIFATNGTALNSANPNLISPLSQDFVTGDSGTVSIKRGTAGGRQYLAVQWGKMQRYGITGDERFNFQAWLWSDGKVRFVYGPISIASTATDKVSQVGLLGPDTSDVVGLNGATWDNPAKVNRHDAELPITLTVFPPSGRSYLFALPPPPAVDLAVRALLLPGINSPLCAGLAAQPVSVVITNLGSTPISTFTATLTVNGVASTATYTLPAPLGLYERAIVSLPAQNFSANGAFALSVVISAAGDAQASNDTAATSTVIRGGNLSLPTAQVVTALDTAFTQGWRTASGFIGDTLSFPAIYRYNEGTDIAIEFSASAFTNVNSSFLVREGIINTTTASKGFGFRVKVGINNFSGTLAPVSSVDGDSLQVIISTDCNQTFQVLKSITQADLAAGLVSNAYTDVLLPITGIGLGQTFTIAIRYTNGGTPPSNSYSWIVDDIRFITGSDAVAGQPIGLPALLGYCAKPITLRFPIANRGFDAPDVTVGYKIGNGPAVTQTLPGGLRPFSNDTVTFTNVIPTRRGPQRLLLFATANGDPLTLNDTVRSTITLGAVRATPSNTLGNYLNLSNAGYYTGFGQDGDAAGIASQGFASNTAYGSSNSTASVLFGPGLPAQRAWFISPAYVGGNFSNGAQVSFKLSVTANTQGATSPGRPDNNDSLLVAVRTNCAGWRTVASFTVADTAGGRLNQALQTKIAALGVSATDTFQVAFIASNGGTAPARFYRWHLNFVRIENLTANRSQAVLAGLSVYPNPAKGKLTIALPKAMPGAQALLFDLQGRSLRQAILKTATEQLSLDGLTPGVYLLRVSTPEGLAIQRVTVE